MRDRDSRSNARSRGIVPTAGSASRSALLAAFVVVGVLLATSAFGAEPTDDPPADGDVETTVDTAGASTGHEATKKPKTGPPVIAVPIFITEPAVGYGLGAAVGHCHKKKEHLESGGSSHAPVLTADSAPDAGKQQ